MRVLNEGAKIGSQPGQALARAWEHLASLNGRIKGYAHIGSQRGSKGAQNRGQIRPQNRGILDPGCGPLPLMTSLRHSKLLRDLAYFRGPK